MKKINFILLFYFILLFSFQVSAASTQAWVERIQNTYDGINDLQLDFVQDTYVKVLEEKVSQKGVAKFQKSGKFWIEYQGSKRSRTYQSDGKKLWVYRHGDQQVQVYQVSENVPVEALSFLGGFANIHQDYLVDSVSPQKKNMLKIMPSQLMWLKLTPKRKQSNLKWLVVGFDSSSALASELYFLTDSGNLSHYRLKNVQTGKKVSEKFFKFKKKGVREVKAGF